MSTNFDLQSILNKTMGQIESLNASNGSNVNSSDNNFVNSVWGMVQNGEAAASGDDQQKAQAITNIVQNLMSMLTSLGTNENSKATNEVKKNDKKADELSNKADETATETETKVKEIVSQIETSSADISKAIETIKELGGDKGLVAEAQQKLEEQLAIIEENKSILNDGVSSPEAKQEALNKLTNAASVINGLVESINGYQKEIEAQNNIVESASENVSTLVEDTANVISEGASTLQSYIQQGQTQTVTNTVTSTTGTANEVVGAKATAMGTASNSLPVLGQSAGAKLIQIGTDQTSAGKTRLAGSAKTLASLTKAIGKMGADLSNLSSFTNTVGQAANNSVDLIGQYGSELEPVITATGSWANVADVNAQFEEAIDEYRSANGMETSAKQKFGRFEQKDNTQGNGQFNFDTNLYKQAFGI